MIKQASIIFGCLLAGEGIRKLFGLSVPSSVIGMLLLTLLLHFRLIKPHSIKSISDFFIKNMAFFFIPPGVGILSYFGLIKDEIVPIAVSAFFSTLIVLAVVGLIYQKAGKDDA